ncbi:hypothetical protein [Streptomyces sp. CC228A]|uniref:hypothetical protein n=1 Tax=Streptomyces sp. CC228A TaxID=2898186 RepID=UPI001F406326|nr:hypothetical protein [Streptomyces sp. CC228A]
MTAARARAGVLLGALIAAVGVALAAGAAYGLMAAGVSLAAWCLFVVDVSPAEGGGKEGRP